MKKFNCLCVTPINLSHPNLAIATNRAGGIGILDREFCPHQEMNQARKNLERLQKLATAQERVGLRLRVEQIEQSQLLLEPLCQHPHWLILGGGEIESLASAIESLPPAAERKILIEVLSLEQARQLASLKLARDGVVAKGHESGGWVGEDSAFILSQKIRQNLSLPVYVQGGIGIHTAAACRAAGAAGVVLDDQLWLMAESPLKSEFQRFFLGLSAQEAIVVGERLKASCRVLSRPGFSAVASLQKLAQEVEMEDRDVGEKAERWRKRAATWLGWGSPQTQAWPVGQAVGMGADIREKYKTTNRFIQALLETSEKDIKIAKTLKPLQPNSPLAASHQTKYPIVQGPMTRVSDRAAFAQAVSRGGGLPMLALALMGGAQVQTLLQETQALLGDRSWGIGILGFVPQSLRQEQLEVVRAVKPPFALIAGGRPDQAAQLEAQGIATYLHVPTPTLLKIFLQQGARRFVFEGRECGGHLGPLSSFVLWESTIATLLKETPRGTESEIHVLFAGGIHDRHSALMISTLAAPLAARGMKIGVLMGTAYIFTQEAVASGAVVPDFQRQVVECTQTINLETGPGHASRCAVTPFAHEFAELRRKMTAEGRSAEEIQETLEQLTLGRLRIASKGLKRTETGELVTVNPQQQIVEGMYMIGQVATLRDRVIPIEELHREVSEASTQELSQLEEVKGATPAQPRPSDIAIIGIATLVPKAQYPEEFWQNILRQVNAITEIPSHRWDWCLYYDPDRRARDKVYSKWGGFFEDIPFDPLSFGIPPKSLKSIEPLQLLTLEVVRRALENAGYEQGDFDREHTSVILGAGGGLADLGGQYATRAEIPRFVAHPDEQTWERLPEWTEETFPGLLLNVIAGRVSNRFDLGGSNFTVDAACASSLAAIDLAVRELESGRSNLAIAGGVDTCQSPFAFFCFSKTQALSPQGKVRTFDKKADGIVISEGIAILVLKRLADAERDGDRIYAVIKGVASSSDGKALGLTAPHSEGQRRAVERAYQKAGLSPKTLALYEAHGTGTVAGDHAELTTILETLTTHKAPSKYCVLGSVKTLIGHTKCTAGVIGLIKVALSLYHQVLPPHAGVEQPLEEISEPHSPVYLLKTPRPWLAHPDHPRRGAVSAFGFGGTNFHAVLEEYPHNLFPPCLGEVNWPWELLVLRGADRNALTEKIQQLQATLVDGEPLRLRDLASKYNQEAQEQRRLPVCASLVVESLAQLQENLLLLLDHLQGGQTRPLPPNIQLGWQADQSKGLLAFLFPGQGSQYPEMMREVAIYWQEIRSALELADTQLQDSLPKLLSQYIYPPSAYNEEEQGSQRQQLTDTQIAQPAIGSLEMGCLEIAKKLGLEADLVAGHSYGEYGALYAAGVFSQEDFLRLSAIRSQVMARACGKTPGAMAVVQITRDELGDRLQKFPGLFLANHNAPLQSVISGHRTVVQAAVEQLNASEIKARMLPVAGAFHSDLVTSAQIPLQEAIATTAMNVPQIPVYANSTAKPYEANVAAIRHQLGQHLLAPVEFVSQIETMYEKGARVFLELGPKNILTNLTKQILEGKDYVSISFDDYGGGLRGFLTALGTLVCAGVQVNLTALFDGRKLPQLDLVPIPSKSALPKNAWLLNGGSIRPQTEPTGYAGKLPPLNQTTKAQTQPKPSLKTSPALQQADLNKLPSPSTGSLNQAQKSPPQPKISRSNTAIPNTRQASLVLPSVKQNLSSVNSKLGKMSQEVSPNHPIPTDSSDRVAAYQAYQETMRHFLHLQEQVMYHFLSGMSSPAMSMTPPAPWTSSATASSPQETVSVLSSPPVTTPTPLTSPPSPPPISTSVPKTVSPNGKPTQVPVTEQPKIGSPAPASHQQTLPDEESLQHTLVKLVSERTGYPPEMLGIEQDLEAELGIDSIKRVEILGALQSNLPESLATRIQQQMESLTRVKSLQELIEQLLPSTKASVASPSPASTPSLPDRESLQHTLVKLVSERTGYPPEMLGIEQDLEAELGIDSIKRVEILGALQSNLPESLATRIQQQMESLTRVKSLQELIEQLLLVPTPVKEESSLGKQWG